MFPHWKCLFLLFAGWVGGGGGEIESLLFLLVIEKDIELPLGGVHNKSEPSPTKQDTETTRHDVRGNYVGILKRGVNSRYKRMLLESLHSTLIKNGANCAAAVS